MDLSDKNEVENPIKSFHPCKVSEEPDNSLSRVNKEIFEIKKKIQLSEGQRKALFEACDTERKANADTILRLKREIAEVLFALKQARGTIDDKELPLQVAEGLPYVSDRSQEKTLENLDFKVIDLRKKLDILRYETKKKDDHLKLLIKKYEDLLSKVPEENNVVEKPVLPDIMTSKKPTALETEIHRMEIQCNEARLIRRKYRLIKDSLTSDSVRFENVLKQLEESTKQQEKEIKQLKKINREALAMRDDVLRTLEHEQQEALTTSKLREEQIIECRRRVNARHQQLVQMERRIIQQSTRAPARPASEASDHGDSDNEEDNFAEENAAMEASFEKLKEATGALTITEVLERFKDQRETQERLSRLRKMAEDSKVKLEKKKLRMLDELELFKFTENKDKDEHDENVKQTISEIEEQKIRLEKSQEKIKGNFKALDTISCSLHNLCVTLRCIHDSETGETVEEPAASSETTLDLLQLFSDRLLMLYSQTEEPEQDSVIDDREPSPGHSLRHPVTPTQMKDSISCPPSYTVLTSKSPLPMIGMSITTPPPPTIPGSDDEEEVPSRGYLKRQAQLIVDVKSRRKPYRIQLPIRK